MPRQRGGTPFATAVSTRANFCHPVHHATDIEYDEDFADIHCFNASGQPANTAFEFTSLGETNFSQFESANSFSPSTNDSTPLGWYSSTDSSRNVSFDFEGTLVAATFVSTGAWARTLFLVNAYGGNSSCKPAYWIPVAGLDNFMTVVVCHDVTGAATKQRITAGVFGVGP